MAPTEESAETAAAELESKLKVGEEDGEEVDEVVEGAEGEASAAAKKKLGAWIAAVAKARKALGVKGFVAIKKGSALYKKAKSFYK